MAALVWWVVWVPDLTNHIDNSLATDAV